MIRFDNIPPEVMQAMCTPMHQILPPIALPAGSSSTTSGALYLGSLAAVNDPTALREARISHLVQVLDVPWLPLSEKDGFSSYKIPLMDDITVDLRPHLEAVCLHIDRALKSGKSVLVHCQQVSPDPNVFLCVSRTNQRKESFMIHQPSWFWSNSATLRLRS